MEKELKILEELECERQQTKEARRIILKMIETKEDEIQKSKIEQERKIVQLFDKKIEALQKSKDHAFAMELLKDFKVLKTIDEHCFELRELESSKVLLDYFIETDDIESVCEFLKIRAKTFLQTEKFDDLRIKFKQALETEGVAHKAYASEVIGFEKGAVDIESLIDMVVKHDKQQGIYKSDEFERVIVSASIGEFGDYFKFVYYDGKFGHADTLRKHFTQIYDQEFKKSDKVL